MTAAVSKKIINRMNNLTLQEKRGLRALTDAIYVDIAAAEAAASLLPAAAFTGSDYYFAADASTTAWAMDHVVGYEQGIPSGLAGGFPKVSGFSKIDGTAARATTVAADGVNVPTTSTTFTTGAAHGLVVGDWVTLSGYAGDEGYNGLWEIQFVDSTTTFEVTTPFTADLAGYVTQPDGVLCATTGVYSVQWDGALETATTAGVATLKWFIDDDIANHRRRDVDLQVAAKEYACSINFVWDATAGEVLTMGGFVNTGEGLKVTDSYVSITRVE